MARENPFSLSQADETPSYDAPRRKKLAAFGLGGPQQASARPESADLAEQPLYGGKTSREATVAEEAAQPSKLATELVERAPYQQEATPLLRPEERLGNILTGEEGSYGGLNEGQRAASLRDFFGPGGGAAPSEGGGARQSAGLESAAESAEAEGPSGVMQSLGTARQATGYASMANKMTGNKADDWLKKLFRQTEGGFGGVGGEPGEVSGINASVGYGANTQNIGTGAATMGAEGLEGGVSGAGLPGTAAPPAGGLTASGALGGAGSLLGLIANLYALFSGKEVTPGQIAGILQSGGGLASSAGNMLGLTGLANIGGGVGAVTSAATLPLAFGSAYNAFASDDPRDQATGYGTAGGAGIGALLGSLVTPGIGTIIGMGAGAGAGGYLGNLLAKNLPKPHSMAVRQHWGEVATDNVNNYMYGIIKAGNNGDLAGIQQALGADQADGRITVRVTPPGSVQRALGVPPGSRISDLSQEQFIGLIKAYQEHEGVNKNWFQGTGELPYLRHDEEGRRIAEAVEGIAHTTFKTLVEGLGPGLALVGPVAPLVWEDVGQGYRMAPQLDYGVLANDVGALQPRSYEDAKNYLGNTALRGGGVPVSTRQDLSPYSTFGPEGGPGSYLMPTQAFSQDYQATLANLAEAQRASDQRYQQFHQDWLDRLNTQGVAAVSGGGDPAYNIWGGISPLGILQNDPLGELFYQYQLRQAEMANRF